MPGLGTQPLPDTAKTGAESADTQQGILQPPPPTLQTDINELLAPYMKELANLGPEYGAEMQYLAPYLGPEYSGAQQVIAQQEGGGVGYGGKPAVQSPDEGSLANLSINATGEQLAGAVENQPTPGFGAASGELKGYEQSLPYQQAIAAGLGYQKYLQTYGGLAPSTANWPESIQKAYGAIGGTNTNTGLQTPQQAAKDQAAGTNAQQVLTQNSPSSTGNG